LGREHELRKDAGIPAAIAANVAALVRCKNSLRFHDLFIANYFLLFIIYSALAKDHHATKNHILFWCPSVFVATPHVNKLTETPEEA
jgi:hypothetical protein